MSASCDEEVAETALTMAVVRRRPKAGWLHQSDRGCQDTSRAYRQRLEQVGVMGSLSRKGNWWDHAALESFFGSRHARNAWGARSIHLMKRHAWLSSPIWRSLTIACDGIQHLDTSARSATNKDGDKTVKQTFDIIRLLCYNKSINVTLRTSVSPIAQLLRLGTLRKRVKVTSFFPYSNTASDI
jgi:hypothetical protein